MVMYHLLRKNMLNSLNNIGAKYLKYFGIPFLRQHIRLIHLYLQSQHLITDQIAIVRYHIIVYLLDSNIYIYIYKTSKVIHIYDKEAANSHIIWWL